MKKLISMITALVLCLSLAGCSGDSGTTKMTMGTGSPTGTYYAFGGILGQYIGNHADISVNVVSTDGSKANIQGIAAGDYQLGFTQSDVMSYAWDGLRTFDGAVVNSFRVVAGLYAETVQLITTDPEIKSVADLKGKSVSIGAPGSGVYFNAVDVLAAAGLTEDDINAQHQDFAGSADSLKDGKIDAAFIVAGAPTPAVVELFAGNKDARLVPIDGDVADSLMKDCPFYSKLTIPAGTYKGQSADIDTVTVKATLIVSEAASEEDVYNLTKAIFDNVDAIAKENAKGAELSLQNATEGITLPFHAGAAKYFAENNITVASK